MKLIILAVFIATVACLVAGDPLPLTKRDGFPNSAMKPMQCPSGNTEVSCLVTDSSWPTNDFPCGQDTIRNNVIKAITNGILKKTAADDVEGSPPFELGTACQGGPLYKFQHNTVTAFYVVKTECDCKAGVVPSCSNVVEKSQDACNISKIVYCGASSGQSHCAAK
ncbi:hypothetical protein PGT21_027923 [Puccinia graminis f. sp. tritici]|uniref:Secreted protein n=1 Tax=Puccinia graminis f. sp. tritici TaxID=56615 RepID=A0A5B0NZL9_PUCGR|nr:hypothetical protein PGT21_027923 [Puccinia graminis f. sp. tritici]KAA1135073.1 hypothetical protein PGTUg99_022519 [Puccinia graminis f. sp. tritici]